MVYPESSQCPFELDRGRQEGCRHGALGGVHINKQRWPATCAAANLPASGQSSVGQPWQPLLRQTLALSQNLSLEVFSHVWHRVGVCVCMCLSRRCERTKEEHSLTNAICVCERASTVRCSDTITISQLKAKGKDTKARVLA